MTVQRFGIDGSELRRRKTAFLSLMGSLFVSLTVSAFVVFPDTVLSNLGFFAVTYVVLLLLIAVFIRWTVRFFQRYELAEMILTEGFLERHVFRSHDRIRLSDLSRLGIKRTFRGHIREIGLWFRDQPTMYLDGVRDFGKFLAVLQKVKKDCPVSETSEPFDYDHPCFYPILGTVLGISTVIVIRLLAETSPYRLALWYGIFAMYLLSLGGYFFVGRPLEKRYGYSQRRLDMLFGSGMVLMSLGMFVAIRSLP